MTASDIAPPALADAIRLIANDGLLAFDVDGVLAPIVAHADSAQLTPGVLSALDSLSADSDVAIVSGRSLADLEQRFGFPRGLHVIGSHGLEVRGEPLDALTNSERFTFEQLQIIGERAIRAAGAGAWLEHKPASVVVHVREADPTRAEQALDAATRLGSMIVGAQVKAGSAVVELLARTTSKGDALLALAAARQRAPIVYFGDDVTDEDAFTMMGPADISVRVGPGVTGARFRLADSADVAEVLRLLTSH